jgi:hypothetical protein
MGALIVFWCGFALVLFSLGVYHCWQIASPYPQFGKPEDPGSSGQGDADLSDRSDERRHKGGLEKLIDDFNDHIDMVNSQKKKTNIRSAVGYFIASCGAVYTAVQIAVTVSAQ